MASKEIIESKAQEEEASSLLKYFSVVWCKASKKKHKKWEGDAILIVKGRSFILKDMEGKDIGRGIMIYVIRIYDLVKILVYFWCRTIETQLGLIKGQIEMLFN